MSDKVLSVPCAVKVTSSQLVCDQKDESSFETEGLWCSDARELEFDDIIKNDSGKPLRTRLVLKEGRVLVYRDGGLQFDFDSGKSTSTLYRTPVGELPIDIVTKSIFEKTGDDGGQVRIDYTLIFGPDAEIICTYEIEIVAKAAII